jgi:predicted component of type VI protein secretion system
MILGREPGGSPQHVALPSSTVSRRHARLDFTDGHWELTNLSRTNPVVVNDESLSSTHGERVLMDGDRIELGDVVLRFVAH